MKTTPAPTPIHAPTPITVSVLTSPADALRDGNGLGAGAAIIGGRGCPEIVAHSTPAVEMSASSCLLYAGFLTCSVIMSRRSWNLVCKSATTAGSLVLSASRAKPDLVGRRGGGR